MTIRAFLGHSFTDDDKDLVIAVTEFLDAQKVAHPEFDWIHATQAKAMSVVEKVLPLIRQSDIFIGLCTRKERVVSPREMKPGFWNQSILRAPAEKVGWKTSDWIIQEIGIAIQRDMVLILLLEDGVREPGGLIGDLEYIPFSRENLAPAFTRLTQMLGTALQNPSSSLTVSDPTPQKAPEEDQIPESKASIVPSEQPQSTWQLADYERALFSGVFRDDKAHEEAIFKAFLASPLASTDNAIHHWHATREFTKLILSKGGSLSHLEALVDKNRSDPEMVRMLARANRRLGNQDIGAVLYEEAARAAAANGSARKQADYLAAAIETYTKIQRMEDAHRVFSQLNALDPSSPELEPIKLESASLIAESEKQTEIRIAALERQIALKPTEFSDRFTLAYLYGEVGDHEASLFHYSAIPEDARTSGAWNNLGVARDRINLSIRAVDAFRKAEELGSTLAMGNLAQSLISAGFAKEAEAVCTAALAMPDFDTKVPEALTRIKSEIKEESEKEEAFILKAGARSRFMRDAGQALTRALPDHLAKQWRGPLCTLEFDRANDRVRLIGNYTTKGSGLMGLFGQAPTPANYLLIYEGPAHGCTFFVKVTRQRLGATTTKTLLGDSAEPESAVIVLSADGLTLKVMEKIGPGAKLYELVAA